MRKLVTTVEETRKEVIIESNKVTLDNKNYTISKSGDVIYVHYNGKQLPIDDIIDQGNGEYRVEISGYTIDVKVENPLDLMVKETTELTGVIKTPLTGVVSSIFVKLGDIVENGAVLMTISAMKMENKILSKTNGRVKSINVNIGDQVNTGSTLVELEPQ